MVTSEIAGTGSGAGDFTTTHWSVVMNVGAEDSALADRALAILCQTYWYPLYSYARRLGHGPEDAQDLTQEFFARLLQKGYLHRADATRGKFRTFLLTALKRFLVNEWVREHAAKRGGGQPNLPLDIDATERRYSAEPVDNATPEKVFEKRWALTLLDQVLTRLRQEFAADGRAEQFEQFKTVLWGEKDSPPYAELAARLGMTEGALKVAVHRLRKRYREVLRAEVANTVASPDEVDDELRHLIAVMTG
jgi:RNA polymerase sigma-70 factor (ECF subfamily)